MIINQQTRLNMVIGYPLQQTKSPLLHNTVYQQLQINAVLLAFANQKIRPLITAIKALASELVAVTIPFKVTLLNYLDECSAEVEKLQAANTIVHRNGQLIGHNTDVDGVAYALRNTQLTNTPSLIIGAGGAARSAAYVLQKSHAQLFWYNRTAKNARQLISQFGGELLTEKNIAHAPIGLIINTTPLGMYPQVDASPLPDYSFQPHQTVFDMVYNPLQTALLKKAQSQGAKIISGIDMFIAQGLRQIELWQNKNIITDTLMATMTATLQGSTL